MFGNTKETIIFAAVLKKTAQMAELVDALVSGTSFSNGVQVRVLFWAQKNQQSNLLIFFLLATGFLLNSLLSI